MTLIDIVVLGKTIKINPLAITIVRVVPLSTGKYGVALDWLPKNSAIIELNQDGYFDSILDALNAITTFKTEIENATGADVVVYKPSGSLDAVEILNTLLVKENLGNVYNIRDEFETTQDFLEGEGILYPPGTNIVVIDSGGETYMFDALAGFIDLSDYVRFEEIIDVIDALNWDEDGSEE